MHFRPKELKKPMAMNKFTDNADSFQSLIFKDGLLTRVAHASEKKHFYSNDRTPAFDKTHNIQMFLVHAINLQKLIFQSSGLATLLLALFGLHRSGFSLMMAWVFLCSVFLISMVSLFKMWVISVDRPNKHNETTKSFTQWLKFQCVLMAASMILIGCSEAFW